MTAGLSTCPEARGLAAAYADGEAAALGPLADLLEDLQDPRAFRVRFLAALSARAAAVPFDWGEPRPDVPVVPHRYSSGITAPRARRDDWPLLPLPAFRWCQCENGLRHPALRGLTALLACAFLRLSRRGARAGNCYEAWWSGEAVLARRELYACQVAWVPCLIPKQHRRDPQKVARGQWCRMACADVLRRGSRGAAYRTVAGEVVGHLHMPTPDGVQGLARQGRGRGSPYWTACEAIARAHAGLAAACYSRLLDLSEWWAGRVLDPDFRLAWAAGARRGPGFARVTLGEPGAPS